MLIIIIIIIITIYYTISAILFVPVVMYGSETILWKEKERFIIRAVQMDTLRGLLGIKRMDRVLNARVRE